MHWNKLMLEFTCFLLVVVLWLWLKSEGQNQLHELPESFGNLRSLRYCQLSKNKIEILPSSFGNLANLQELRLDNNIVRYYPDCRLVLLLDLF